MLVEQSTLLSDFLAQPKILVQKNNCVLHGAAGSHRYLKNQISCLKDAKF